MITTGTASVDYNATNIINSQYTCKTEKIGDNDTKDVINLTVENEIKPLGIHYTHHKKVDKASKIDLVSIKRKGTFLMINFKSLSEQASLGSL